MRLAAGLEGFVMDMNAWHLYTRDPFATVQAVFPNQGFLTDQYPRRLRVHYNLYIIERLQKVWKIE